MSMIGPVQSRCHEGSPVLLWCYLKVVYVKVATCCYVGATCVDRCRPL